MTRSAIQIPTKIVRNQPEKFPVRVTAERTRTCTSVFNFDEVAPFLSQRPLRRPLLDEDAYDIEAVQKSIRENVFFSFDEICGDL